MQHFKIKIDCTLFCTLTWLNQRRLNSISTIFSDLFFLELIANVLEFIKST